MDTIALVLSIVDFILVQSHIFYVTRFQNVNTKCKWLFITCVPLEFCVFATLFINNNMVIASLVSAVGYDLIILIATYMSVYNLQVYISNATMIGESSITGHSQMVHHRNAPPRKYYIICGIFLVLGIVLVRIGNLLSTLIGALLETIALVIYLRIVHVVRFDVLGASTVGLTRKKGWDAMSIVYASTALNIMTSMSLAGTALVLCSMTTINVTQFFSTDVHMVQGYFLIRKLLSLSSSGFSLLDICKKTTGRNDSEPLMLALS
jgi:hypothetical protein